jgi:hypothetical protein
MLFASLPRPLPPLCQRGIGFLPEFLRNNLRHIKESPFFLRRLYGTLDIQLPHKIELEQYLKERQGILFNLEYALLFTILETERVQA